MKTINSSSESTGFGDVDRIEVVKFLYDNLMSNRTYQGRKAVRTIIINKSEDVKTFLDIFNTKEKVPGTLEIAPSDYEVTILKDDGSKEIYELQLYEEAFFLSGKIQKQFKHFIGEHKWGSNTEVSSASCIKVPGC